MKFFQLGEVWGDGVFKEGERSSPGGSSFPIREREGGSYLVRVKFCFPAGTGFFWGGWSFPGGGQEFSRWE